MQMDFPAHCKTQSQGKSPRPLLLFRPLQLPQILFALTCPIPALYLVRIRATKSETKQAIDTSAQPSPGTRCAYDDPGQQKGRLEANGKFMQVRVTCALRSDGQGVDQLASSKVRRLLEGREREGQSF